MKNPVTTITGAVLILLSVLTLIGVITSEQSASLVEYSAILIEAIAGIIAVFVAKDKGGGI